MEDEQFIRMGGGLKEIADRAHAEGAGEEFNIKAAAATLRVILHQDSTGDVVCGGRGSRERVGAKGGGGGLDKGPGHTLPSGQNSVDIRERLALSKEPGHGQNRVLND